MMPWLLWAYWNYVIIARDNLLIMPWLLGDAMSTRKL